jgi:hypothetical protein
MATWGGVETVPIATPRQQQAIGTVDGLAIPAAF